MTGTVTLPPDPRTIPELTVNVETIRACGVDLLAASTQIDDLGTFAAGSAKVGDWHGTDSTAYHNKIRSEGATADAMSLALRKVAQEVDTHADAMQGLVERRESLGETRSGITGDITDLKADIDTAKEDQVAELQGRSDGIKTRVESFGTAVTTWLTDIQTAEKAMNDAFNQTMTMEQVTRKYAGVTDPADAALATKPGPGASPEEVFDWWQGLTEEQRLAIMGAAPEAIGNLDGIPAGARSDANSVMLERDLHEWRMLRDQDLLTSDEEDYLTNAEAAEAGMNRIKGAVDPVTGDPLVAQLYIYDPHAFGGEGRIAIAAGNLDTADNVALTVPGFSTDGASMGDLSQRALNIYEASRFNDPSQSVASMMWIGYDAPDFSGGIDGLGVIAESMAENGGERLAQTIDGLRATRPDDPAHMTVIGHSYGSTTTGHAATDHGLDVDDIVLVGSPGPGDDAKHAGDLGVGEDHVWVGTNSSDPVAMLGDMGWVNGGNIELGLGKDPAEDNFGANRFQAEATDRAGWVGMGDHSKYWDHDSESLSNISRIVNGDYGDVQEAEHKYDPWYAEPQDPERDRDPTTVKTRN